MYSSSKFIIKESIQNPLFLSIIKPQLNNINISLINDNNSLKENNSKYEIGLIRRFEFISSFTKNECISEKFKWRIF